MIDKNPCYMCEDRVVGCHATCEKYKSWRKAYDDHKKMIIKQKQDEQRLTSRQIAAIKKFKTGKK